MKHKAQLTKMTFVQAITLDQFFSLSCNGENHVNMLAEGGFESISLRWLGGNSDNYFTPTHCQVRFTHKDKLIELVFSMEDVETFWDDVRQAIESNFKFYDPMIKMLKSKKRATPQRVSAKSRKSQAP